MRSLQETVKAYMPTITKQALRSEFGVLRATTFTNNHMVNH